MSDFLWLDKSGQPDVEHAWYGASYATSLQYDRNDRQSFLKVSKTDGIDFSVGWYSGGSNSYSESGHGITLSKVGNNFVTLNFTDDTKRTIRVTAHDNSDGSDHYFFLETQDYPLTPYPIALSANKSNSFSIEQGETNFVSIDATSSTVDVLLHAASNTINNVDVTAINAGTDNKLFDITTDGVYSGNVHQRESVTVFSEFAAAPMAARTVKAFYISDVLAATASAKQEEAVIQAPPQPQPQPQPEPDLSKSSSKHNGVMFYEQSDGIVYGLLHEMSKVLYVYPNGDIKAIQPDNFNTENPVDKSVLDDQIPSGNEFLGVFYITQDGVSDGILVSAYLSKSGDKVYRNLITGDLVQWQQGMTLSTSNDIEYQHHITPICHNGNSLVLHKFNINDSVYYQTYDVLGNLQPTPSDYVYGFCHKIKSGQVFHRKFQSKTDPLLPIVSGYIKFSIDNGVTSTTYHTDNGTVLNKNDYLPIDHI